MSLSGGLNTNLYHQSEQQLTGDKLTPQNTANVEPRQRSLPQNQPPQGLNAQYTSAYNWTQSQFPIQHPATGMPSTILSRPSYESMTVPPWDLGYGYSAWSSAAFQFGQMSENVPIMQQEPRPGIPAQWPETGRLGFGRLPNSLHAVHPDISANIGNNYSLWQSHGFGGAPVSLVPVTYVPFSGRS